MHIETAVEQAITECIREGILREFLIKNRSEAKSVSIYEYDQEKRIKMEREEAWMEGQEVKLTEQIRKKLHKGKNSKIIAEELEEEESHILFLIQKYSLLKNT